MKNTSVFNHNTFRLYIPFRKYIDFENILKEQNIDYSIDFDMPNSITDFARFYFDKKDENLVNQLIIENEINATDDFFIPSDYKKEQKMFLIYLKFFGILLLGVIVYFFIHNFIINKN